LTKSGICAAYKAINTTFLSQIPTDQFSMADLFGKSIRLVFHDAGEANVSASDRMGPDGCLSSSSDNNGLVESTSPVMTILEPIWQANCDKISRADFWALWAKMIVEYTAGYAISINYQFGRADNHNCEAGKNRLPSAQGGMGNITQVFVNQMGLTLNDAGNNILYCSINQSHCI